MALDRKDWRTPPDFFRARWALWQFNVDVCTECGERWKCLPEDELLSCVLKEDMAEES
jgi:hypothetical protein